MKSNGAATTRDAKMELVKGAADGPRAVRATKSASRLRQIENTSPDPNFKRPGPDPQKTEPKTTNQNLDPPTPELDLGPLTRPRPRIHKHAHIYETLMW